MRITAALPGTIPRSEGGKLNRIQEKLHNPFYG
jgi:hypothetical protein